MNCFPQSTLETAPSDDTEPTSNKTTTTTKTAVKRDVPALPYPCQPNGNGVYGNPNFPPKVIKIDIMYKYEIVIVRNAVA